MELVAKVRRIRGYGIRSCRVMGLRLGLGLRLRLRLGVFRIAVGEFVADIRLKEAACMRYNELSRKGLGTRW